MLTDREMQNRSILGGECVTVYTTRRRTGIWEGHTDANLSRSRCIHTTTASRSRRRSCPGSWHTSTTSAGRARMNSAVCTGVTRRTRVFPTWHVQCRMHANVTRLSGNTFFVTQNHRADMTFVRVQHLVGHRYKKLRRHQRRRVVGRLLC